MVQILFDLELVFINTQNPNIRGKGKLLIWLGDMGFGIRINPTLQRIEFESESVTCRVSNLGWIINCHGVGLCTNSAGLILASTRYGAQR